MFASVAMAQTVVFSAQRVEMYCPASGDRTVRVLLDNSLKGHLDDLRYDNGVDCRGATTDEQCKEYKSVEKLLKAALSVDAASGDAASFYLLELNSGKRHSLQRSFTSDEILYNDPPRLSLEFAAPTANPSYKPFVLMANVKKLDDGTAKGNAHIVKVEITPSCDAVPAELPKAPVDEPTKPKDLHDYLVESKEADHANIGASFSLNGSKGHRIYSHEIGLELGRMHRLGLRGAYDIIPFFLQHKFARDEKSPKDDLTFGFKANHLLLFDPYSSRRGRPERDLFNSLETTISGHIETDFLFSDQVNLIASWRSGLPLNLFDERSSVARITPFIGYELGRVLKEENPTNKNRTISRPLFGMDVFIAPYRREKLNPFEIELHYIRRLLLRPENEYFVNADGDEVLGGFNRSPKDWVKARFTFNYNDTFAPFFQYTYGREPGKYLLQNSVMEAGIKVYLKWDK